MLVLRLQKLMEQLQTLKKEWIKIKQQPIF
jgi:hypothetical protein